MNPLLKSKKRDFLCLPNMRKANMPLDSVCKGVACSNMLSNPHRCTWLGPENCAHGTNCHLGGRCLSKEIKKVEKQWFMLSRARLCCSWSWTAPTIVHSCTKVRFGLQDSQWTLCSAPRLWSFVSSKVYRSTQGANSWLLFVLSLAQLCCHDCNVLHVACCFSSNSCSRLDYRPQLNQLINDLLKKDAELRSQLGFNSQL